MIERLEAFLDCELEATEYYHSKLLRIKAFLSEGVGTDPTPPDSSMPPSSSEPPVSSVAPPDSTTSAPST